MIKWEYKIITCQREFGFFSNNEWDKDMEAISCELGEEGWELVSVVSEASDWGQNMAGVTTEEKWIFKRQK